MTPLQRGLDPLQLHENQSLGPQDLKRTQWRAWQARIHSRGRSPGASATHAAFRASTAYGGLRVGDQRSNVLVMESLRADAFTRERMPRLYEWAQRGFVAKQHYGGSYYSEAGAGIQR